MKNVLLRLVLGLTLALSIVGLVQPAQASSCVCWVGSFCCGYAPDVPAGWSDCGGDTTAYAGQVLLFTGSNWNGYCIRRASNFDAASLGDFDGSSWHVGSFKNNASWYLQIWDGTNYTGSTSTYQTGNYSAPAWQISSLKDRHL